MQLEVRDKVTVLAMQAGRANAINATFLDGLEGLIDRLSKEPPGALVLTGYDRFFSAGLDLPGLMALSRAEMKQYILRFSMVMLRLFSIPRPVVAAINGHAIAGGCVIALQADYRMMVDADVRIGLNEVKLGVGLPAVVVESLRCQVPAAALMSMCLEGQLLSPQEAQATGLVHEVVAAANLLDSAVAKAASLAEIPPPAYAQVKFAIRRPVLDAMEHRMAQEADYWLDTWFSEPARTRVAEAASRLSRK